MESLALVVTIIFFSILALSGVAVTLSVLAWAGKLHKAFGYVSAGLLFLVTAWAFSVSVPLGMWPLIPLLVTIGFALTSKRK